MLFLFFQVVKYLEENDRAGEVDGFKKNITKVVTDIMGRFKELQFFTGKKKSEFVMPFS